MTVNKLNKWCQDCPHSTCETCDITWTDIEELKKDIKDNYISKDKIREKMDKLFDKIHVLDPHSSMTEIREEFMQEGGIDVLEELLEEE